MSASRAKMESCKASESSLTKMVASMKATLPTVSAMVRGN